MERFPHHRYLRYLVSRKLNDSEITASCLALHLAPPTDFVELRQSLGTIPKEWRPKLHPRSKKFRTWLRVNGILDLWVEDKTTRDAKLFVHRRELRKTFDSMLLAHGDPSQARDEMFARFPPKMVPELKVLVRYQKLFWDIGAVPPDCLYELLEGSRDREEYLPAVEGDLVAVYGRLGLQQRVSGETFLQNVLEAANQQALRMRKTPDVGGQQLAGMATAIKLGMEAMDRLEESRSAAADTSLRTEAAAFVARSIEAKKIPSIDELDEDIIDVGYAEGGSNVRRLPVRK